MDSPVATRIFQRLFAHETCSTLRWFRCTPQRGALAVRGQTIRRHYRNDARKKESGHAWQQKTDIFPEDRSDEFKEYPTVSATQLREWRRRPRRVKMLMRDFIEDSLYNPHYGYFPTQAVIFSPSSPFQFGRVKDELDFNRIFAQQYAEFEDALDEKEENPVRQLWHTPTELFKPYYGEAIARYLMTNYQLTLFPYHDLLIYEMGAGNGTLMLNILDHIRAVQPDIYDRTQFKIIEISSSLAELQQQQLQKSAAERGHLGKVEVINKSIFDWDTYVSSPCFFLALEVFDNFAHDMIRYDHETEAPLQCHVLIDSDGDFYEFYDRVIEPVAARFLKMRGAACEFAYQHPLQAPRFWRRLKANLPLAPNLSRPEYVPTRLMQFFDVLNDYFPAHRLLTSDFHALTDAVEGVNAPVVQTRYQRTMVPVTTPLVQQGYFDILFPTDFRVAEDIYRTITGKLTRVSSHEAFFKRWADLRATETRSGENPLLTYYKNASVMMTV